MERSKDRIPCISAGLNSWFKPLSRLLDPYACNGLGAALRWIYDTADL